MSSSGKSSDASVHQRWLGLGRVQGPPTPRMLSFLCSSLWVSIISPRPALSTQWDRELAFISSLTVQERSDSSSQFQMHKPNEWLDWPDEGHVPTPTSGYWRAFSEEGKSSRLRSHLNSCPQPLSSLTSLSPIRWKMLDGAKIIPSSKSQCQKLMQCLICMKHQ